MSDSFPAMWLAGPFQLGWWWGASFVLQKCFFFWPFFPPQCFTGSPKSPTETLNELRRLSAPLLVFFEAVVSPQVVLGSQTSPPRCFRCDDLSTGCLRIGGRLGLKQRLFICTNSGQGCFLIADSLQPLSWWSVPFCPSFFMYSLLFPASFHIITNNLINGHLWFDFFAYVDYLETMVMCLTSDFWWRKWLSCSNPISLSCMLLLSRLHISPLWMFVASFVTFWPVVKSRWLPVQECRETKECLPNLPWEETNAGKKTLWHQNKDANTCQDISIICSPACITHHWLQLSLFLV